MNKALITVFILLFGVINHQAFGGGASCSGGGTVVVSPGQPPVLLEIYLANAANLDTPGRLLPRLYQGYEWFMDPVNVGFSFSDPSSPDARIGESQAILDAFALAHQRIEAWKKSSPTITREIDRALKVIPFYAIPEQTLPPRSETFVLPFALPTGSELYTAAWYDPEQAVIVPHGLLNAMGHLSRGGLVLKEALRELQNGIKDRQQFSNAQLQKLVTKILLFEPQKNETLETAEYIDGELLKTAQLNAQSPANWTSFMTIQRLNEIFSRSFPSGKNLKDSRF